MGLGLSRGGPASDPSRRHIDPVQTVHIAGLYALHMRTLLFVRLLLSAAVCVQRPSLPRQTRRLDSMAAWGGYKWLDICICGLSLAPSPVRGPERRLKRDH